MNKVLIITLPEVYRFLIYIGLIDFDAASKPFFGKSLFSVRDDPHIAQITERGRDRMMMFQELALFPWLDVMSNVLFGLKLKPGLQAKERREAAEFYFKIGWLGKICSREHSSAAPTPLPRRQERAHRSSLLSLSTTPCRLCGKERCI
jgi:hypothetical protein